MTVRAWGRDDSKNDVDRMCAAVSDLGPAPFRDRIDRQLRESTMAPGLLTRLAARVTGREVAPEEITSRVVGVQLIYEGLTLMRALVHFPPWDDEPANDAEIELLVAEVLVARGFSLLARTEAVPEAVELVCAFGRDETNRRAGRPDSIPSDRALEADVFELAIVAGVTATGADRPPGIRGVATGLAESLADEPDRDVLFSETVVEELDELVSGIRDGDGGI